MIAVWLFLKSNWKGVILAAVGLALVYFMGNYQARGSLIATLQTSVSQLNKTLFLKDDTLAVERARNRRLKIDTARLNNSIKVLRIAILEKDAQLRAGALASLQSEKALEVNKQTINRMVNSMSASEKRHAAELGLAYDKLSYAGLTDADTANNSRIAKLTNYGKARDSTIKALSTENGTLREENRQLKEDKAALKDELSDLEKIYNNIYIEVKTDFAESKKEKHPLGIGQKKSKERLEKKVISRLPKTTYNK